MVGLRHAPALAQFALLQGQQRRGHVCIGHGAVGHARARQAMEVDQPAQLVAGRLRVQAARQQHGAGKRLQRGQACQRQFALPEAPVKRGVVRHHRRVAHKAGRRLHHLTRLGRGRHHGVGDAGQLRDERRNPGTGLHQALKPVHYLPLIVQ